MNSTSYKSLSVYRLEKAELRVGDLVRLTRNNQALQVSNGDRFKVTALDQNHITLSNEKKEITLALSKPLFLEYGYATTIHSSQGMTVDRVLIDLNTKSLTTSKEAYYVAISRARQEALLSTDNLSKLPKSLQRETRKTAALDLSPLALQKQQKSLVCKKDKEHEINDPQFRG